MTYEERITWLMGLGYPGPVAKLPTVEMAEGMDSDTVLLLVLAGLLSIGDVPNG